MLSHQPIAEFESLSLAKTVGTIFELLLRRVNSRASARIGSRPRHFAGPGRVFGRVTKNGAKLGSVRGGVSYGRNLLPAASPSTDAVTTIQVCDRSFPAADCRPLISFASPDLSRTVF